MANMRHMLRPEVLQYMKDQRPLKLFQILNKMGRYGVGRKVTRVIWKQEDTSINVPSYWTLTKVLPNKVGADSFE